MAVIHLSIVVPNLDEVRANFDRIKIHRSTAGEAGPYVELTTPSNRPVLEENRPVYEFTDTAGNDIYWYRSSFYHTVSGLESSLSDPQQGEGAEALSVLTVEELKDYYLFGVDLTRDDGEPFSDAMYRHYIKEAVAWLESHLGIPITPRRIVEEKHDFIREDYSKWMWLNLEQFPVLAVEEVKLVLPGEQVVKVFDATWLHVQKDSGQLQLMPPGGSVGTILLGASGAWLPFMFTHARTIPDAFRVTYSAGFAAGEVPENLRAMIGKKAAMGPLNIAGDLIAGAGIAAQSLSIDGLSQSISTTSSATNAGYGARILQYWKDIKEDMPQLKRYYRGLRLAVA
jgi:hypothetical protein